MDSADVSRGPNQRAMSGGVSLTASDQEIEARIVDVLAAVLAYRNRGIGGSTTPNARSKNTIKNSTTTTRITVLIGGLIGT